MTIRMATKSTLMGSSSGGGASIPVGTLTERPSNPKQGDLFFNKTYDTLEQYTKGGWQKMGYQIAMALKMNNMELM